MKQFKLVLIVLLAASFLIVILQNTTSIETSILFMTVTMPLSVLLLIMSLFGFLAGVLVAIYYLKGRSSQA